MAHTFRTVEEEGCPADFWEMDWLFAARFSCVSLPDRLNYKSLAALSEREFPGAVSLIYGSVDLDDDTLMPAEVCLIFAPDVSGLPEWMDEQLERIEQHGIHHEDFYWSELAPVLQTLWAESDPSARVELCQKAGLDDPMLMFDETMPQGVRDVLHEQITAT